MKSSPSCSPSLLCPESPFKISQWASSLKGARFAVDFSGCSCPEMYSPVCDTQGQTHVSECKMKCQRRSIAHSGPCASSYGKGQFTIDLCSSCGSDDSSSSQSTDSKTMCSCAPKCYATRVLCVAVAGFLGCGCPAQFQPVCDTQGNNHPSRCALQCARARFAYDGSCLREIRRLHTS